MSAMHYEPCILMHPLRGGVVRAADPCRASRVGRRHETRAWMPAVDIREQQDRYLIHADIPGVDPEAIEVSMQDGVLSIRGERGAQQPGQGAQQAGLRHAERLQGSFVRRFGLPDGADTDAIRATARHGVLEIVIPKQQELRPRRIQLSD